MCLFQLYLIIILFAEIFAEIYKKKLIIKKHSNHIILKHSRLKWLFDNNNKKFYKQIDTKNLKFEKLYLHQNGSFLF